MKIKFNDAITVSSIIKPHYSQLFIESKCCMNYVVIIIIITISIIVYWLSGLFWQAFRQSFSGPSKSGQAIRMIL